MSYGDGTIIELKNTNGKSYTPKHWRIMLSYSIEVVQEDGNVKKRRKRVSEVVEGTKADAKARRDELKTELDAKGQLKDQIALQQEKQEVEDTMTLSAFIQMWHDARTTTGKASPRTLKEDLTRLEHVEAFLGNTLIRDITPQMIDIAYAKIRKEHNLSGTTLNRIHILLKNVFEKAIDYDIIVKNPCKKVAAPKINKPHRRSLQASEGSTLLKKVNESEDLEYLSFGEKENRMAHIGKNVNRTSIRGLRAIGNVLAIRIGLATGMRRGEVLGLVWRNVDLNAMSIKVCQSLTTKLEVKTPKTQAGVRRIAIDPLTAKHLLDWKEFQKHQLAKIGVKQSNETPVCCSDIGGFNRPDNFEHWWSNWRKANGFEGLKFHELRHTQATLLLANNVDLKTVQTRMGHANPSITLAWYAHAIPENDHEAANMLANLFVDSNPDKNSSNEITIEPKEKSSREDDTESHSEQKISEWHTNGTRNQEIAHRSKKVS